MFSNILCATDLSPRSTEALRAAVQLAAHYNIGLTVLNVHDEFLDKTEMVMLRVSVEKMQENFRETALKAKEEMRELVTSVGVDEVQVNYLLHEGKPADTIIKSAQQLDEQHSGSGKTLIVIGSNSRESLKDLILGSVAEHVVQHSELPVLVIPHISG